MRSWDEEAAGADLVCSQVGGSGVLRRDGHGAPPSTRDFDIELPNGDLIALEVTQEARPAILAQRAYEAKQDRTFTELKHDWVVNVREPCDLDRLRREILGVVVPIEAEGREVWIDGRDALAPDHAALLRSLGVRMLYRQGQAEPGSIVLGSAAVAGSTGPNLITKVVEKHANAPDNVKKLRAADDVVERHLLIWILADCHAEAAAMSFGFLPPDPVALPPEVDVVWVATAYEKPAVWRCDRQGWSVRTTNAAHASESEGS